MVKTKRTEMRLQLVKLEVRFSSLLTIAFLLTGTCGLFSSYAAGEEYVAGTGLGLQGSGVALSIFGGKHINPTNTAFAEAFYGTEKDSSGSRKSYEIGFGVKSIWGKTFFSRVGIHNRSINFSSDMTSEGSDGLIYEQKTEQKFNDTGLAVGIGNQWKFSSFSFGVKWVEIYVPLVRHYSRFESEDNKAPLFQQEEDEDREYFEKQRKNGVLRALGFFLQF
jgi:hypothetical protein